jgi:hypothetical protein
MRVSKLFRSMTPFYFGVRSFTITIINYTTAVYCELFLKKEISPVDVEAAFEFFLVRLRVPIYYTIFHNPLKTTLIE